MPFKSKAQQGWMFENKPSMAKEFSKETNFKSLPEKVGIKDYIKKRYKGIK